MDKSIYVITGSLGFVGFNLSELLINKGHKVIGVDIEDSSSNIRNWRYKESQEMGVNTIYADISNKYDINDLGDKLNKEGEISSIFHLAGLAGVRKSVEQPSKYYNVNLRGTYNILQLVRRIKSKSLVFASTSSVYGDIPTGSSSKETDITSTISPYSSSKLMAEKLCKLFSELYSLNVSVLRYFTVYGIAGRPDMSILKFIHKIYKNEPITIYGDGFQERDFTYISDVCNGTFSSSKLNGFNIMNLGGSRPEKLINAVKIIERKLQKKADIIYKPQNNMDVNRTSANIENSKKLINWNPKETLNSGLSKTIDWYIENAKSLSMLS